jgi:hypothetical protein
MSTNRQDGAANAITVQRTDGDRLYRRGRSDARQGHPPAQSADAYLKGYSEALAKKSAYQF